MTKIDIISGFLGAGKTTFIKKMLEEVFTGEKIVLIENEFGEIGIDGGFLKDSGIEISEMNSGCICCSLVGDFGRNLREVLERFSPDRILIEPSGVGKLSDVMKSVQDVESEQHVALSGLVTVVNTLKATKQMRAFGEFFNNQIENASIIVLSRTQKASPEQLEEVVKAVREKNPKAAILTTPWEELEGKQIYKLMEQQKSLEEELMEAQKSHSHDHGPGCSCGCHDHDHSQEHHHHHHHADEVFTSWGVETPHLFTKDVIETAMKAFCDTTDYGVILRAKGMVPAKEGAWIYFDMVDGEYELREGEPDYTGRLCVIGTDLKEEKLATLFGIA